MKDIAVIGLGKFGYSLAVAYAEEGGSVLAIDTDEEKVQEIADVVTYAARADVADPEVVKNLGLENVDIAVIAITNNMEAAVMATILSKELGVPEVIAKANNEIHAKVLTKVGADRVIFPEKDMGIKLAKNISLSKFTDIIDLKDDFSIIETKVPKNWVGKNLSELNPRKKYGFNVIAMRDGERLLVNLDPLEPFRQDTSIIVIGRNNLVEKVF
ncbi:MAG: TrkA family potassium uptake protein [Lachnospiraceae bacterium]|nr:TrkA family potassium uptake protein [Lachnospiraceae bacterium]